MSENESKEDGGRWIRMEEDEGDGERWWRMKDVEMKRRGRSKRFQSVRIH